MKDRLPKIHVCDCSYARKERKRSKTNGGFIIIMERKNGRIRKTS